VKWIYLGYCRVNKSYPEHCNVYHCKADVLTNVDREFLTSSSFIPMQDRCENTDRKSKDNKRRAEKGGVIKLAVDIRV